MLWYMVIWRDICLLDLPSPKRRSKRGESAMQTLTQYQRNHTAIYRQLPVLPQYSQLLSYIPSLTKTFLIFNCSFQFCLSTRKEFKEY